MARLDLLTANDRPGAYPASWYAGDGARRWRRSRRSAGEVDADVCVIGGGYTGLSAALHLARGRATTSCCSRRSGSAGARRGATAGRSAPGQRRDQDWLERAAGPDARAGALGPGRGGEGAGRGLVARHGIDCDLRPGVLHAAHRPARGARATTPRPSSSRATTATRQVEPLDRAGIAAMLGQRRLSRRRARPRRRRTCTRSTTRSGWRGRPRRPGRASSRRAGSARGRRRPRCGPRPGGSGRAS